MYIVPKKCDLTEGQLLGLSGVRFLTGQSGFLAICPVENGDQTGQALVRFLVLLCIVLQTAQHQTLRDTVSQNKHLIKAAQCDCNYHK